MSAATINVEVIYALPEQQALLRVQLAEGATVEDAIRQSGVLDAFPDIDLAGNKVGIFSKLVKLNETVRDKDRVEIYRPLIANPKEVRRKRAEEGKVTKKGGGDAAAGEHDGSRLAQINISPRAAEKPGFICRSRKRPSGCSPVHGRVRNRPCRYAARRHPCCQRVGYFAAR